MLFLEQGPEHLNVVMCTRSCAVALRAEDISVAIEKTLWCREAVRGDLRASW